MNRVVVFVADGFEECEALIVVDILKRAKCDVNMVSIMGRKEIISAHGVSIVSDELVESVDLDSYDMVVLPGGLPGTEHLANNRIVRDVCLKYADEDKTIAAICAAPSILANLGLLEGRNATCHPSFEKKMHSAIITGKPIEVSGNIITARGLGVAIPFALELVKQLEGLEVSKAIAESISYFG